MTVQEFYETIGGDYHGVRERLMVDSIILKFLGKYLEQKDHQLLHTYLEEEKWIDAFRAVHTMKGVALNLGLTSLAEVSSILCEILRPGEPTEDITLPLKRVDEEQEKTVTAIRELLNQ